jgi:hypothetical protein
MRSRVLGQVLTPAIVAATISVVAACGGTAASPAQAGKSSPAAQSGPSAGPAPHSAGSAQSHASAAAAPGPDTATKHTPAQPGPQAGTQKRTQPETQPPSAPGAGVVRFGPVTSEDSTASSDVSPDGAALTTTFADLEANLEKGPVSNGTRMVMPLTGGAQNAQVTVYASGYAFTEGATARLSLTVNGQTVVKDFPVGTDGEFVQQLELPAIAGSPCQLSLTLEVDQAPGTDDGAAYLNVTAIDAEIT